MKNGYVGILPPATIGVADVVKADMPVFTAQPQNYSMYQRSGKLVITGASATPVTSYQWQRSADGISWSDVAGQTSATLQMTGVAGSDGSYRLVARNGNSDPAISNTVTVYDVYMGIQNDSSATDGSANGTTKTSDTTYTDDGPAGTRYYSAFFKLKSTGNNFTPPDKSTARAVATWATTNATVAPATPVSATGQLTCKLTAGQATLTTTYQNLSSKLEVSFS